MDLSGFGAIHEQSPRQSGDCRQAANIVGVSEIPSLARLTDRLLLDFAKTVKSIWATNLEFPHPKDIAGFGETHEPSPSQSGNFRHAENIADATEIPRLA